MKRKLYSQMRFSFLPRSVREFFIRNSLLTSVRLSNPTLDAKGETKPLAASPSVLKHSSLIHLVFIFLLFALYCFLFPYSIFLALSFHFRILSSRLLLLSLIISSSFYHPYLLYIPLFYFIITLFLFLLFSSIFFFSFFPSSSS